MEIFFQSTLLEEFLIGQKASDQFDLVHKLDKISLWSKRILDCSSKAKNCYSYFSIAP